MLKLVEERWVPDGEDEVALRGQERLVARLTPFKQQLPPTAIALRPDSTYVIVGELGGLELRLARWMVAQGAQHLVLIGGSNLPSRSTWQEPPTGSNGHGEIAEMQAGETLSATVEILAAELGEVTQLTSTFKSILDTRPVQGIIYLPGVSMPRALGEMDADDLQSILQPTMTGAWVVHQLSQQLDLDFFVLFSSIASVWGSRGLGHDAAAHHFLDALAHYRRALGLPALSINLTGGRGQAMAWGQWMSRTVFPRWGSSY
jgi:hypothetical protein